MPRFLHQGDPDLSDLNRAKRNVNRDYKKQYSAQDGNHDNLGQLADKEAIYNTLSQRLTGLFTALLDFSQQLNAPVAILNRPIGVFRPQNVANLQQLGSRILTEIRAVNVIFSRIKSFNIFTPPEAQQLQEIVQEISDAYNTIVGASQQLGGSPTAQQIDEIIASFSQEFLLLQQFLMGASKYYRATEGFPTSSNTGVSGAEIRGARGRGRKRGGFESNLLSGIPQYNDPISRADYARAQGGVAYHHRETTMTGGAIVPAYNGLGVFGSDGYRIGDYFSYTDPRRFY